MPSNRKKIRGKGRKYLAVDRWRENNEKIDFDSLTAFGAQYARLDITPWNNYYRTGHNTYSYRNPTPEFQRYILQCMLEIHDSWKKQLANRQGLYDLKLWIYLPNFIYSKVILTREDVTPENENELVKNDIEFPFHRFPGLRRELQRFEFQGYFDDEIFYHNEIISEECLYWGYQGWKPLSKGFMLNEMTRLHATELKVNFENGKSDIKYTVRKGNIWITTKYSGSWNY